MSQENVEIVRRGFEAYERGDLSGAIAVLSPEMVTYVAPPIPVAGSAGDQVVVRSLHTSRGAESGVPVETDVWYVWTVREGKAVRAAIFNERREALEAAGLSE